MDNLVRRQIVIPAVEQHNGIKLRVAAYCRVSTDSEDQKNSFCAQNAYYTALISAMKNWQLVDIYADEGITGTSAKRRKDFQRLLSDCRRGLIDKVLVKSVSRFARNTKECLEAIRELKALGISVQFEEQHIDTKTASSELMTSVMAALAQAESESISKNVSWGKRQAMREGKVSIRYDCLYGYRENNEGFPEIHPEQAQIVQRIYQKYLTGGSLRMIRDMLNQEGIPYLKQKEWTVSHIRSILTNEKYWGDVLMQKAFVQDCISKKVVKNTGQLPMYLIENNHPAVVSRDLFQAVQAEMARRNAIKSPSEKTGTTGRGCFASKYALSERLICGECGTSYRRCTWKRNGKTKIVWRCVSRLDYGTKYCHKSPTMEEASLHQAILDAINSVMCPDAELKQHISQVALQELTIIPDTSLTLSQVSIRMKELETQFESLLRLPGSEETHLNQFREIAEEMASLKETREKISSALRNNAAGLERIQSMFSELERASQHITQWEDEMIRQLVHTVRVLSANHIQVILTDGTHIDQQINAHTEQVK